MPEKARLLKRLKEGAFNVPPFYHVPAEGFKTDDLAGLAEFLQKECHEYKVIARSAHPQEEFFKGGTFDSLETYADVAGIKFARQQIISRAKTKRRLTILRQQHFNHAPDVDYDAMGLIVMPFIEGNCVMAKRLGGHWEFGYSAVCGTNVQAEPFITLTPHDRRLLQISEDVEKYLGFRCEIEYIISEDGIIYVVQAKDISHIDTLEQRESERSVVLDGVRRIRKRRNYRERPIFVMDNKSFYLRVIGLCEDMVQDWHPVKPTIEDVIEAVQAYESELERFALRNERFAVLGLSIQVPGDLFQVANHYLDDTPEAQHRLSKALHDNMYKVDQFLAESDTLIAKDKLRRNLCSHDAYGVDTVRNPLWSVYWDADKHDAMVRKFTKLGFRTGDMVGIEVDADGKPRVFRL